MFLPHILEISFDILPSINARHKNHHQAKAQGLVDVSRDYYTNQKIPSYPPRRSTSRGWVTLASTSIVCLGLLAHDKLINYSYLK